MVALFCAVKAATFRLTAGVYQYGEDGRRIEKLTEPVYDPMTRSNDGKCDP
ncbi:MAG: hypothetical protein ACLUE8_18130 [Lachnospiraceae bacterium]